MELDYNIECDKIVTETLVKKKLDAKIDEAFRIKFEVKVKPLQNKITKLEAENRRMKIAIRFLESKLNKYCKLNTNLLEAKKGIPQE